MSGSESPVSPPDYDPNAPIDPRTLDSDEVEEEFQDPSHPQQHIVYHVDDFIEDPLPPVTKKFLSSVDRAAMDALEGFVAVHYGLRLLGDMTTVVKADLSYVKGKVALVAGGGSGHEPYAAGFVGHGMLTAAIMGRVFQSPSGKNVEAIFHHIAAAEPSGILLIMINYTGQRLNFGLAVENARRAGLTVTSYIVGDDCINTDNRVTRRRGQAGAAIIFKLAGAMAAEGATLDEIVNELQLLGNMIGTLGVTLRACSLPGEPPVYQIPEDELEIGAGIHGEKGIGEVKMDKVEKVIGNVFTHMLDFNNLTGLHLEKHQDVVLIVNNLGSTSYLEELIVCRQAISDLEKGKVRVLRAYNGRFMTSLDMAGVQLTLFKLSTNGDRKRQWLRWLDAPTEASHWPDVIMTTMNENRITPQPSPVPDASELPDALVNDTFVIELDQPSEALFTLVIRSIEKAITKREQALNDMDGVLGDGDTGTTLKKGMGGFIDGIISGAVNLRRPRLALSAFSDICQTAMTAGASRGLYSLFFSAAARAIHDYEKKLLSIDPERDLQKRPHLTSNNLAMWVDAYEAGVFCINKYGGAAPGDRTMLDAMVPALKVLKMWKGEKKVIKRVLHAAAKAAQKGAAKTARMTVKAARTNYLNPSNLVHPDPGAAAVAIWIRAVYDTIAISIPDYHDQGPVIRRH